MSMIGKMLIKHEISLDLDELCRSMARRLDRDELFGFIENLDKEVEDWGFTLKLFEYFSKEKEVYDEEVKYYEGMDFEKDHESSE